MSTMIDTLGTFIGIIEDSGVSTTKNGFPQSVLRLKAMQKYIDQPNELEHFKLTEPGYVDWSSFDEEITAFLVLFKNAEVFNDETKLLNYDQLQSATGWDGTEFDSLANGNLVGKSILFRVEENEYQGKVRKQVSWIDNETASATRQLKSLDAAGIKALSSKLKITKTTAKPVAAKAVAAKPSGKPAGKSAATTAPAPATTTPTVAAATKQVAPKTAAPKAKTPPPASTTTPGLPGKTTKEGAWEYLMEHKGDNEDGVVADAFMSAMGERFEPKGLTEETATEQDWAAVRDLVVKDLSLS